MSSAGGRGISSTATPHQEETCPGYWLFPVLTSGTAEETKEQKGSETVAGEGKRKK